MHGQLLKEVRRLQDQIDRFTDSRNPEAIARRKQLWACLEWRLHKLAELERAEARAG